jgi:acetoacetyl-CoA reductase/3-oxoacyl-[acyl-carrier protein] reductase
LIADGVSVVAAYRSDASAAEEMRKRLSSTGAVELVCADVSDASACASLVDGVVSRHGRLDYLVNNAGQLRERRVADLTSRDWAKSLQVNLSSAFFLSQAALVPMVDQQFGRIVNVGSVSGAMGSAFQIDYASAKAGVVGLTRSLARAVARKGVTVNCVLPGGFSTEMLDEMTLTKRSVVEANIPIGRFGEPRELAHVVASLLHDDASYVTGAVIAVDGGLGMGL